MINTNTAFDMLPIVVTLYEKLDIESYIKKTTTKNKDKVVNNTVLGIDLFKYILKNSQKVKDEVFEIVSIFEETTIEAIKLQSFSKTIATLKEIFTDKETAELFKSAIK